MRKPVSIVAMDAGWVLRGSEFGKGRPPHFNVMTLRVKGVAMEPMVVPITLHEVDKKFVLAAAQRAGTDVETFIICAAVRRAIHEERLEELEALGRAA